MSWQSKSAAVAIAIMAMSLHSSSVQAMPEQGKVVAGQGEIVRPDDKTMVINQKTDRLALDWQKFNIAKDEKVHFDQNSKSAIAINRVVGDGRSIIDGSLSAKGHVFVINPNGVLFGKNSSVDVGGLVASTANVTDEDMRNFTQGKGDLGLQIAAGREASVINAGTIKAEGGLVALHATTVENTGTIANEGGTTALAAAKNLNIAADTAGKLNFTVSGSLANAKALNSGTLQSDGGYIVMTAKSAGDVMSTVVNNTGVIEAKTLHTNDKGEILLDGGENGQVEVSGTLDASGTEAGQSAGSIKVIGQKTVVNDGTNLLARGAIDGGKIETSGDVLNLGDNLNIDASGDKGSHGTWLLDPLEVVISDPDEKPTSAYHGFGTVIGTKKNNVYYNDDKPENANASSTYSSTTWIDASQVINVLHSGTDVTIQAISTSGAASITLDSPLTIAIGNSATKNPTFTLEANRNITIAKSITTSGSKGLNIMLNADTDGDGIGAVIVNADITTNGGSFTSLTGGDVTHTSNGEKGAYNAVNVGGGPAHDDITKKNPATVGTYFGGSTTSNKAENRSINTGGGAIALYGETAIGLNGGTLNLNTGGGDLKITGIVNSGNSYDYYIYDYDKRTWNKSSDDSIIKQIESDVEDALKNDGAVPVYEYKGINYTKTENKDDKTCSYTWTDAPIEYSSGNRHYVFRPLTDADATDGKKDLQTNAGGNKDWTTLSTLNPRWYMTTAAGWGYNSFIVTGKSTMTINDFLIYLRESMGSTGFAARYNSTTYDDAFKNNATEMANLRQDIAATIAHNWYAAQELASRGSVGKGDQVGDSYLATIVTRLENSLTTPNGAHTMWVGGRGSGIRNRKSNNDSTNVVTWYPADPTHPDGFYWVTGPEGLATNNESTYHETTIGTGTKFWDTASTNIQEYPNNYGYSVFGEAHWSTNLVGRQPDDNGPFLTVGYGSDNQWDDANFGGETTWGFVKETNLAHSGLNIQAGKGAVNLQGNIGGSEELDTVTINTTGAVTTGGSKDTAYSVGTINADHGVTINGGDVTIGGRITTGASTGSVNTDTSVVTDNVSITSAGNLTVHGITATGKTNADGTVVHGGNIQLKSTSDTGVIKLDRSDNSDRNQYATDDITRDTNGNLKKIRVTYAADGIENKGTLIAGSGSAGAVIIDAQGQHSSFVNQTRGDADAITTGNEGTWLIYSASPDKDKFGTNLNSGTDAQWTAKSDSNANKSNAAGTTLKDYPTGSATLTSGGKFVFQTTPVITLSSQDYLKIYGDEVPASTLNELLQGEESFTGLDGKTHSMTEYTAFKEGEYTNYISNKDSITITSIGANGVDGTSAIATRTQGKYAATDKSGSDGKNAVYDLVVNTDKAGALNGYALNTQTGHLEIKKREAKITVTGKQTYGDAGSLNWTDSKDNLPAGSKVSYTTSIKADSDYTKNKGSRSTANHGTYKDSVFFDSLKITDSKENDVNINDNYNLTTTGIIEVGKAKLTLKVGNTETTYGTAFDPHTYTYTLSGNTNKDSEDDVRNHIEVRYSNGGEKSDPTNSAVKTQNVGDYDLTGTFTLKDDTANNYANNYEIDEVNSDLTGKATVKPKDVYFYVTGNGKTIGDVVYTVTDTNPKPDYPLNPNDPINSQLAYGETVTPSYRPDGRLPNGHYGVSTSLPGYGPIDSGKVYGNYRYHYDGDITVNLPSKPDIVPPVNPPVTPGTGTVTPLPENPTNPSNTPENTTETTGHKTVWDGERDRGGDRPEDKRVVTLPFFKVLEDKTTHRYGTYDVAKRTTEVKIEPSAQVLPEPNQPATQYRELTTELTTDKGTGEFTLKYNGSRFTILPDDDAAMKLIVVGDETKNRALFEKALHVAFTQMGLEVADLDGVYIHFGKD